jgi:hypothetical protein
MNVNMQQATQAAKKMADAGGDSHFLEEQMNPTRIKQYLDSGKDYDKVKGMKWCDPGVPWCLHFIVMSRLQERRSWVVSFFILGPFAGCSR